ncbi:MAG: hypothetical protein H6713_33775 [Myxococcales bacterium]|nr:hypothetical protein [Myxococcales bacterium]MCB9754933.1 hypothetical protein [Myxococcales bacterium]
MTTLVIAAFIFTLVISLLVVIGELRDNRRGRVLHQQLWQAFDPRLIGARRRAF